MPLVSVVVPACNEEAAIEATVRALLASRGLPIEVIAIDDRSTDRTPEILDRLAQEFPSGLRVLHVRDLPAGWLGKPHALAQGTRVARAPLLLFTDADILFREDALLRSVAWMQHEKLDHFILASTPITKTVGEKMMISAIQLLTVWATRLWKISDPEAPESLGVGSFGLLRRQALEAIGGWEALRMEVLEDVRLGWEIKRGHGLRQGFAYGRDLVRLHWGAGVWGLAGNMTKNGFSLFRYSAPRAVAALAAITTMILAPVAALFGPRWARWSIVPFAASLGVLQARGKEDTGIPAVYAALFPMGAMLFVYSLGRSVVLTLVRGGVVWRGTLYPIEELRRSAGPLR